MLRTVCMIVYDLSVNKNFTCLVAVMNQCHQTGNCIQSSRYCHIAILQCQSFAVKKSLNIFLPSVYRMEFKKAK